MVKAHLRSGPGQTGHHSHQVVGGRPEVVRTAPPWIDMGVKGSTGSNLSGPARNTSSEWIPIGRSGDC